MVRQQYLDLLNREPNQGEVDRLVRFINECGGEPKCLTQRRSQAALQVFRSDEFKKTQLMWYGAYLLTFGRRPTYDEWKKRTSVEELVKTPEVKASYPTTDTETLRKLAEMLLSKEEQYNSAFVVVCYFDYLKRDPDPQGYNFWLQTLKQNSNDLSAVITGFIDSGEYRSQFGAQ
jgi:hypothetical protein